MIFAVGIICLGAFGVLESTAANAVNSNEEDEHDNVKDRELVPVSANVFQYSGLARIALVAK